jgi:hypothetical protein
MKYYDSFENEYCISQTYSPSIPIYKISYTNAQELRKLVFAYNLSTIYLLFPKITLQLLK